MSTAHFRGSAHAVKTFMALAQQDIDQGRGDIKAARKVFTDPDRRKVRIWGWWRRPVRKQA